MKMPSTISGWCMWLFFLLFGLGYVIPAVMGLSFFNLLLGILALGYAVLSFFGQ